MRDVIAPISNVKRLMNATNGLMHQPGGKVGRPPRIAMVWGEVGLGKTTATRHVCLIEDAILVEAYPDWTPRWMTADIAEELGAPRSRSTEANFRAILGALQERPRAIFIDEADHLVRRLHLVETLRAIHDHSNAPLVLIGMSQLPKAVSQLKQLESRIAHWVEFQPCDLRDVKIMVSELCEIELGEDLVRELHRASGGSARQVWLALERLENFARRAAKRKLALSDLPDTFPFTYARRNKSVPISSIAPGETVEKQEKAVA